MCIRDRFRFGTPRCARQRVCRARGEWDVGAFAHRRVAAVGELRGSAVAGPRMRGMVCGDGALAMAPQFRPSPPPRRRLPLGCACRGQYASYIFRW